MVDRDKELLAECKSMMANDYGILCSPISVSNSPANAIVEWLQKTICNIICTFNIQHMYLNNENP